MKFDESKHKRDSDGRFATKDTPAEIKRADEIIGNSEPESIEDLKAEEKSKNSHVGSVKVDLNTEIQKQFDKAKDPHEERKIIFDYIMNNLRGKYPAEDGREIEISRATADKYTNKAAEIKLRVAPELANLIIAGKLHKIVDIEHKVYEKFAYYEVSFEVGDKIFIGTLNVGIRKDGSSSLYDLNPYKEKSGT